MSLKVILYGDLKQKNKEGQKTLKINSKRFEKIKDILTHFDIKKEELSHIFLDYEYTSPKKEIKKENTRLALFPKDMSLLYKWYFKKD